MRIICTFVVILSFTAVGCAEKGNLTLEPPSMSSAGDKTLVNVFGGDVIQVSGSNFTTRTSITINDLRCSSILLHSSSNLDCTIPSLQRIGEFDIRMLFQGRSITGRTNAVVSYAVLGREMASAKTQASYGLRVPFQVRKCGDKFVAADTLGNRLAVWNSVPTSSSTPFDYVIGQPNVYGTVCNGNGSVGPKYLCTPYTFACYNNKLIVGDNANRRILIWNQFPEVSDVAADVVLGQPDFTSSTAHNGGITAQSLREISDLTVDKNGRLYVVDSITSSRVLIWNSIPTTNFAAADLVIGQPNFTSSGGAASQSRLVNPLGVLAVDDRLFVSDQAHRVLVWNSLPTANGQAADYVLGQANFTTSTSGVSASKFNRPYKMASDGTRLVVGDSNNHRYLIWNSLPTATNIPADLVIGQTTLTANGANNPAISAGSINSPAGVEFIRVGAADWLFTAENGNNRILAWSTFPTSNAQPANLVLGQTSYTAGSQGWTGPGLSPTSFTSPLGSYFDGQNLAVADSANHRVLIWKTFPSSLTAPPDIILGQSSLTTVTANAGTSVAANTLKSPRSVRIEGGKIFVADSGNHRVLIWNSIPTSHFQNADVVLGQPDFTTGTANSGGTATASTLNNPTYTLIAGNRLYISDSINNRVLFWNTVPTASTAPADGVLGQPDLTSSTFNNGGISGARLRTPLGLTSSANEFVVVDSANHRVLVWNGVPASLSTADLVLGQPDMVSAVANNPAGTGAQKLSTPISASIYETHLYLTDRGNNRVLRWNLSDLATHAAAAAVYAQADFDVSAAHGGTLYGLSDPESIQAFADGVVVTDKTNHRILIWPKP